MTKARLVVPRRVLQGTWSYLRGQAALGNEGAVYWGIEKSSKTPTVASLETPSRYERVGPYVAIVGFDELVTIGTRFFDRGQYLGARVHSHRYDCEHSPTDDQSPVTGERGFLSIVVADFAQSPPGFDGVAVYEYLGEGRWDRWPPAKMPSRVHITED